MRILIVEDDASKASEVEAVCRAARPDGRPMHIQTVDTMADAVHRLAVAKFDLIIMDLLLPYLRQGEASNRAGFELARQIRDRENINSASTIVGLSAYPDEVAAIRSKFDELGVLMVTYADDRIWQNALKRTLEDIGARGREKISVDFLVICALDEERDAYDKTRFETVSNTVVDGLNIRFVRSTGGKGVLGAIVRLSNMGLVVATRETTCALAVFSARVVAMSGICAGFSDEVNLGGLVVASPAWEYQAGKWSKNGFEIGAIQVGLRPATRATIDQFVVSREFLDAIEAEMPRDISRPSKHISAKLAPFVTGSAIIADKGRLEHIEKQHTKIAGLDMEVFGVYFACFEAVDPVEHYFAVKCVVDLADKDKNDDLHRYGCIASARAVEAIVFKLLATT